MNSHLPVQVLCKNIVECVQWTLISAQKTKQSKSGGCHPIDNMYFLPSSDGLVCVESPSAIMPGRRMVAAAEYMFTRRFLYTHIVPDCPRDITFCIQYCREFHLITLHYWSSKTWTRSLHQRSLLTPWHLLTTIHKDLWCIIATYWHCAIRKSYKPLEFSWQPRKDIIVSS